MPDELPNDTITLTLQEQFDELSAKVAVLTTELSNAVAASNKAIAALKDTELEVDLLDRNKVVLQLATFGFTKPLKILLDSAKKTT